MADIPVDEHDHIVDLLSNKGPTSSFAWVAGNLRAAVIGKSDNDPIRNGTVEL